MKMHYFYFLLTLLSTTFYSTRCLKSNNFLTRKIWIAQNFSNWNVQHLMIEEELLFYFGTTNLNEVPRYELIKFPPFSDVSNLRFAAFNKNFDFYFENNEKLLSPHFQWFIVENEYYNEGEIIHNCHYLHRNEGLIAAFSFCQKYVHGLILHENIVLEIISLNGRLHQVLNGNDNQDIISIIKPAFVNIEPSTFDDDNHVLMKGNEIPYGTIMRRSSPFYRQVESASSSKLTLETAVFFDEAAYRIFAPYFEYDMVQLKNMLLAYVNMVQALYYEPSLGTPLDIVLVRLEIFKQQPKDLPSYYGERSLLLDSFCNYNKNQNAPNDDDPNHWDIGLYVSGLDFYSIDNGVRNGGTMGLATVGGVCSDRYSCIISEFGATNEYGKPYPSAGFSSVYILAHEIGHNLGMHHDGSSNNCPKDGYIMSPSRGVYGETVWSSCSASVMSSLSTSAPCLQDVTSRKSDLNHNQFSLKPGLFWSAKRQCEILLKDPGAFIMNSTQDMCTNLMCQSIHKSGFYHAGPALDGTKCDENKWCSNGNCVEMKTKPNIKVIKGGWSNWKSEGCKSACIMKSKGYQRKVRTCTNPIPLNSEEGCEGASEEVQLCKDDKVCKKTKRISSTDYATYKCQEFSKILPILEANKTGIQAPYEEERLWTACAIFCKRKNSDTFYSPRLDLNDLNVDPYFPDGTWCHTNGKQNYYCIQHQCVPEAAFRNGKSFFPQDRPMDLIIPQDANFDISSTPEDIRQYLSVDMNGSPVLKTFHQLENYTPYDQWYVDSNSK